MIAISDPWARRRSYLVGGEGHAPVVAVLPARVKPDESIAAPQGHGPRARSISLQIGTFLGTTTGTTMPIAGPSGLAPPPEAAGGKGRGRLGRVARDTSSGKESDVAGKKRPKSLAQTEKKAPTKPKRPKKPSRGK